MSAHRPAVGCMGGWQCPVRNNCRRYHAAFPLDRRPDERSCAPGQLDQYRPIVRYADALRREVAREAL